MKTDDTATTTETTGANDTAPPTPETKEKTVKTTKTKPAAKKATAKKTAKAKPAKKAKAAAKKTASKPKGKKADGARDGSKLALIAGLLQRKEGCTNAEALKVTGWPTLSMPQQAKAAGLKLRKEKEKGEPTRYFGTPA